VGDKAVGMVVPLVVQGFAKLVEVGVAGPAHEVVAAFPFAVQVPAHFGRFLMKEKASFSFIKDKTFLNVVTCLN